MKLTIAMTICALLGLCGTIDAKTDGGGTTPGSVTPRNGSGINVEILQSFAPPVVGEDWSVQLDCQSIPSLPTGWLIGAPLPLSGIPTFAGELLIQGPTILATFSVPPHGLGSVVFFEPQVPNNPAFCGFQASFQGVCQGGFPTTILRLSNALDVVVGG